MMLSEASIKLSFDDKWSPIIGALGFTMVPNALLEAYCTIGLKPSEFLLLVNIDSYRWTSDRLPYPSIETLADRTDMSVRQISRLIGSLEEKGCVTPVRHKRMSNSYSFDVLNERLIKEAKLITRRRLNLDNSGMLDRTN